MLDQKVSRRFKRDRKLMERRNKDIDKLDDLMTLITEETPLPESCHEHLLHGNYEGGVAKATHTECHVEHNWLLVYKFGEDTVLFDRTGSHADLF
jgi:mRNA interferase YafQ